MEATGLLAVSQELHVHHCYSEGLLYSDYCQSLVWDTDAGDKEGQGHELGEECEEGMA
jgi:hypothetical protein